MEEERISKRSEEMFALLLLSTARERGWMDGWMARYERGRGSEGYKADERTDRQTGTCQTILYE